MKALQVLKIRYNKWKQIIKSGPNLTKGIDVEALESYVVTADLGDIVKTRQTKTR